MAQAHNIAPDVFWESTTEEIAWRVKAVVYERALERYNLGVLISAVTAPYRKTPLKADFLLTRHEKKLLGIAQDTRGDALTPELVERLKSVDDDAEFFAILRGDEPSPSAPWLDQFVVSEVKDGE